MGTVRDWKPTLMLPLIMAGAGLALKGVGTYLNYEAAQEKSESDKRIAENESQIQAQRKQAAYLDFKRKELEVLRNNQRARALAVTNATGQGAGQGSGLQGGYGQISGDTNTNLLGLSQNWQIAENTFSLNDMISQEKMHQADIQKKASLGQGLNSLGNDFIGSSAPLGRLTQQKPQQQ